MTPEDLAYEVEDAIRYCRRRVLTVGANQYSEDEDRQKFEGMHPAELMEEALDEIDDLIVYAVMARIRIKDILEKVDR